MATKITRKSKASPEVTPQQVKQLMRPEKEVDRVPAPSKSGNSVFVKLINNCSTYVTPEREVFYAKDGTGQSKVYEVAAGALNRLLGYRDDYGRRFFKEVGASTAAVSRPDDMTNTRSAVESTARGTAGTVSDEPKGDEEEDEETETDTGVMRLKDSDGNPVGVNV